MRTVILATGILVFGGSPAPAQIGMPPDFVVDAFHAALASGDSAAALTLLDPEVVIFESGGIERSREEYRSAHMGADMAFAAVTRRDVTKRTDYMYPYAAIVLSEVRTTGEFRGRAIDRTGVETMVLRRSPDGWRIVHIHWSSRR